MAEKEYSVIEKVKSLVSGSNSKPRVPVSGLNLPWLLAKSDCAFRALLPTLGNSIFSKDTGTRCEYYAVLVGMVDDILESLTILYRESARSSKGQKIEPDPSIPVLNVIRQSLVLLQESAQLGNLVQRENKAIGTFAGASVFSRFNQMEDTVATMEVEMLHNISGLVESIVPAIQKNSEQRKKSLSKNGTECYIRAEKELSLYYSSRSAIN